MRDRPIARKHRRQIVLTLVFVFGIPCFCVGVVELYRASHLWNISDIPEPFAEESIEHDQTVVASKATEWLMTADELMKPEPEVSRESSDSSFAGSWNDVCAEYRQWLTDSDAGIELWKQAMEQPLQKSRSIDTSAESPSVGSIQRFVRLARLHAQKSLAEEGVASAWNWVRAVYRYSRYLALQGELDSQLYAQWAHVVAVEDTIQWSHNPRLTGKDLLEALTEIRRAYEHTPKKLTHLEQWYRSEQEALSSWESYRKYEFYDFPGPVMLYLMNEPERTRRLLNHQAHNLVAFVDQPIDQQPDFIDGDTAYFDVEFSADSGVLAPAVFEAVSQSNFARFGLIRYRWFRPFQEQARQRVLEVVLALEIYRRAHHEYPSSAAELIAGGVMKSIPRDPWSKTRLPIHYERDPVDAQRAKVWSVGRNGTNDGGSFDHVPSEGPRDCGYQISGSADD